MSAEASRNGMLNSIKNGATVVNLLDNSKKSILSRGCDPVMAARSLEFMPKMLGNVQMFTSTNDNDFIKLLQERKYTIVFFAPGACRYDASKMPIPGENSVTKGWDLSQYRELVKQHQGDDVVIVETVEESQTISLLSDALSTGR
jgi:hypothetical protein